MKETYRKQLIEDINKSSGLTTDEVVEDLTNKVDEIEKQHTKTLNDLTVKYTAFDTFEDLLNAKGLYYPSFNTNGNSTTNKQLKILADEYDTAQENKGSFKRAMRY